MLWKGRFVPCPLVIISVASLLSSARTLEGQEGDEGHEGDEHHEGYEGDEAVQLGAAADVQGHHPKGA